MEDLKRFNRVGLLGMLNAWPMLLGLTIGLLVAAEYGMPSYWILAGDALLLGAAYLGTIKNYIDGKIEGRRDETDPGSSP